jgi:hypothetical protein
VKREPKGLAVAKATRSVVPALSGRAVSTVDGATAMDVEEGSQKQQNEQGPVTALDGSGM